MATLANPITPERFAEAIQDLPLESLHAKAAELRNSLAHLRYSNAQLAPFAAEGDAVCADAMRENEMVMARFEARIGMLRAEVEGRGMRWVEEEEEEGKEAHAVNGDAREAGAGTEGRGESGRLSDEELARRMRERMGEERDDDDGGEGGIHL